MKERIGRLLRAPALLRLQDLDVYLVLLAAILGGAFFLLRFRVGLRLADEGFLWYGAEAVLRGEAPMRDFDAYDPGRYFWTAFWFRLWRPGIIPLRFAEAVFKIVGLSFGLLAAKRLTKDRLELAGVGLLLVLWIYPDYKVFDCVLPLIAIYFGFRLFEAPSPGTCAATGLFVGLAGFLGRHHGLYLLLAFSLLAAVLSRKERKPVTPAVFLAAGLIAGTVPFLVMGILYPGFFSAWAAANKFLLARGATNTHLPIPWPWRWSPASGDGVHGPASLIISLLFILVPIFDACSLGSSWRDFLRGRAGAAYPLVCAAVGIPYLHYAFARAEFEHLSVAISPFWMGVLFQGFQAPARRRALLAASLVVSVASIAVKSSLIRILCYPVPPWIVEYTIGEDRILLEDRAAVFIDGARAVARKLKPGESLLAFPHLTALYPILRMNSPIWNIYATAPPTEAYQRIAIDQMERNRVQWAIVDDWPIDRREDLKIENAQPLFWEYLKKNFQSVPAEFLPPGCFLFRKAPR